MALLITSTPTRSYIGLVGKPKMKKIKYNKYINKIGVEFEGLYRDAFLLMLQHIEGGDIIRDCKNDGSVHRRDEGYGYESKECVTQPLNSAQLNKAMELFGKANDAKDYLINETCGLHYHISLNKNYYGYIDNRVFYKKFINMFKTKFPVIFADREENTYCQAAIPVKHFTLSSSDRYRMVNYCYKKHSTVEFRGYGGKLANLQELAEIIQETINLIGEHIDAFETEIKPALFDVKLESSENLRDLGELVLEKYKAPKSVQDYQINQSTNAIELNIDISNY